MRTPPMRISRSSDPAKTGASRSRLRATLLPLLPAVAMLLPSCREGGDVGLIERPLSVSERNYRVVESSMERFRYSPRPAAPAESASRPAGLVYDTPEGWTEKPGQSMRDINFVFGEAGEGECYLARLPGAGGGLAANVNRWRAQMGADPLSEEEIAELPVRPLLGQPARFVSVDGAFSPGMGSTETFPDYRLVGLILSAEIGAVFVKMTGPRDLVEANSSAFDQFVSSIDVNFD